MYRAENSFVQILMGGSVQALPSLAEAGRESYSPQSQGSVHVNSHSLVQNNHMLGVCRKPLDLEEKEKKGKQVRGREDDDEFQITCRVLFLNEQFVTLKDRGETYRADLIREAFLP